MADSKRAIDRMLQRGETRAIKRASPVLPDSVRRISERSDGASLTRAPLNVQVQTTQSDEVGIATAADLRSEIARQVAELVTLSAEKGLLRAGEGEQVAREEAAEGGEDAGDQGDLAVLKQWYETLEAKGLTKPEIEEIMIEQLKGLRRGMRAMAADRKVGR